LLTEKIDAFDSQWLDTAEDLDRYTRLVRMRDCETKALADKATKLRLTNQSATPQAAGTAAKKSTERKPWQRRRLSRGERNIHGLSSFALFQRARTSASRSS
jgi:hypothetical protein